MRIALVDPSRTTRLVVTRMLEARGHDVLTSLVTGLGAPVPLRCLRGCLRIIRSNRLHLSAIWRPAKALWQEVISQTTNLARAHPMLPAFSKTANRILVKQVWPSRRSASMSSDCVTCSRAMIGNIDKCAGSFECQLCPRRSRRRRAEAACGSLLRPPRGNLG
jgi:hypothetical protein